MDGQARHGARALNLRLSGESNQNPALDAVEIRGQKIELLPMEDSESPCTQMGPFGVGLDEIPLTALVDESSLDSTEYADGTQCIEVDEASDVYLSWFTTLGSLDNEAGSLEYNENLLKNLPAEAQPARIYLAIRDGRGGLSISCLEYALE